MAHLGLDEMQAIQKQLQEKYKDLWGGLSPCKGRDQLLWMMIEAGEAADISRSRATRRFWRIRETRQHFIEEMCDVLMYFNDVLLCYSVTPRSWKPFIGTSTKEIWSAGKARISRFRHRADARKRLNREAHPKAERPRCAERVSRLVLCAARRGAAPFFRVKERADAGQRRASNLVVITEPSVPLRTEAFYFFAEIRENCIMDLDYCLSELKALLAIDSPSGFTDKAADHLMQALESLGYRPERPARAACSAARRRGGRPAADGARRHARRHRFEHQAERQTADFAGRRPARRKTARRKTAGSTRAFPVHTPARCRL